MTNLTTFNDTFNKATVTITKINTARIDAVRDTINLCIADAKANKHNFTSKKNAVASYIKDILGDVTADKYFKRSIKVAQLILIDGYKAKTELLTLAQIEQLFSFNKDNVIALMALDDDIYIDAVKGLIKTAKVAKSTNVFSKAKAKKL